MTGTAFSSKKKNSATQQCPCVKGIICVVAKRADTKRPLSDVKVSVEGPTPGNGSTNVQGLSQFDERDPGAYSLSVAFSTPKYKNWTLVDYQRDLSVSGGQITIAEVEAYPTGTLVVEIREENGPFIQGSADVNATGASSLTHPAERGKHTFAKVACGVYDVSARLSSRYHGQSVSALKVSVPESGTGVARMVVSPKTWIEIELLDADGVGVADEDYVIVTADGQRLTGKTDASGRGRHDGIVPGQCKVGFPKRDKQDWNAA
jgi:hypothetical protein